MSGKFRNLACLLWILLFIFNLVFLSKFAILSKIKLSFTSRCTSFPLIQLLICKNHAGFLESYLLLQDIDVDFAPWSGLVELCWSFFCFSHIEYTNFIIQNITYFIGIQNTEKPKSQTNSSPSHLFALQWMSKCSGDEVVSQRERKVLPRFVVEGYGGKSQNGSFFYSPGCLPLFYWLQLMPPNNATCNSLIIVHIFLLLVTFFE